MNRWVVPSLKARLQGGACKEVLHARHCRKVWLYQENWACELLPFKWLCCEFYYPKKLVGGEMVVSKAENYLSGRMPSSFTISASRLPMTLPAIFPSDDRTRMERWLWGKDWFFPGFGMKMTLACFYLGTWKKTKFENNIDNTYQGDDGLVGEVLQCFVRNLNGTFLGLRLWMIARTSSELVWLVRVVRVLPHEDLRRFLRWDPCVCRLHQDRCSSPDCERRRRLCPLWLRRSRCSCCESVVVGSVASQGFGHFPRWLVLCVKELEFLFPLLVPEIQQCFSDFPLEAVSCSMAAVWSAHSLVRRTVRFALFCVSVGNENPYNPLYLPHGANWPWHVSDQHSI